MKEKIKLFFLRMKEKIKLFFARIKDETVKFIVKAFRNPFVTAGIVLLTAILGWGDVPTWRTWVLFLAVLGLAVVAYKGKDKI